MASIPSLPLLATALFLITPLLFTLSLSQAPMVPPSTITGCTSGLLTLTPCGPFVQGIAPTPGETCCNSFSLLYSQQPVCLCLLLNDSTIAAAFPINKTLALELPELCGLRVDAASCPGAPMPPNTSTSPRPAGSQISLGANNNSTIAASPVAQVPPRPNIMGFGFGRSSSQKTQIQSAGLALAALLSAILLI